MKILSLEEIGREKWDIFVQSSFDGWLYQTSAWIDFEVSCGHRSVSFGVLTETDELVAVVPLYLSELRSYPARGPLRLFLRIVNKAIRFVDSVSVPEIFTTYRLTSASAYSAPVYANTIGRKGRRKLERFVFSAVDSFAKKISRRIY